MENIPLVERCQQALELTRRQGADAVEIYGQSVRTITITLEKHDLQTTRTHQETMIGIRAMIDRKQGFACSNDPQNLEPTCSDAVKLAKASPADEHNLFPDATEITYVGGIYDHAAQEFTVEQGLNYAIQMLTLASEMDHRLILGDGLFSVEIGETAIVNNQGLCCKEKGSLFSYFALATAREGDRVSNMDYQFDASRTVSGIDVGPITRRACENALGSLGATRGESFKGTVLLSPNAVQSILSTLILFQINAKNVLRGMSRWGEEIGNSVSVPMLSIIDDGLLPGGVGTASFDREGVAHRRIGLIRDGRLVSLMHNSYSANAMGGESTGHAIGSARSIPGIGPTNLEILPGKASKNELIAEMEQGLLVTRFSGTVDPVSGDFSGVAKGAYLIKQGKIDRPVTGTLVAGNGFEALRSLSGISKERERVFSFTLPYLRLEGLSVTAG